MTSQQKPTIGVPVLIKPCKDVHKDVRPLELILDHPKPNGVAVTLEELREFAVKCYEFSGMGYIDHVSEDEFLRRVEGYLKGLA